MNSKGSIVYKLLFKIYNRRRNRLGLLCGFAIPLNSFDMGLSIAHTGTIVVNGQAKLGKNCRIHVVVNIGTQYRYDDQVPVIGDNVFISPGVKMFGDIRIGNNIVIGANSVMNRSFEEDNICIAGVPARKISNNGRFRTQRDVKQAEEFRQRLLL